jgi:hypothetical protein
MKQNFFLHHAACVLAVLSMCCLSACDSSDEEPTDGTVIIALDHTIDGDALGFEDIRYTSPAGLPYGVTLVEYIISDVTLTNEDGSVVELKSEHYATPLDAATTSFQVDDIPGGRYTEITFTFGLKGSRNVPDALPNTQVFNNMAWPAPLGGGYHNMRFEGRYVNEDETATFAVHTGPTGGTDNSITYRLPISIDVDGDTWTIDLTMNLNEWLKNPTVFDFRNYNAPIMPDQNAQDLVKGNGGDVFAVSTAKN